MQKLIYYANINRNVPFYFAAFPVDGETIKFDVFVSYSTLDLDWVQEKLLSFFDSYGVSYCIHSRDFEVGKTVVDNMIDCVYTSKLVIAVMSENYMASSFCREELSIAESKIKQENNNSLILIRIDDISFKKIPKLFRKKTFLDYNDEEGEKVWEQRLLTHLKLKCRLEMSFSVSPNVISNNVQSSQLTYAWKK